MEIDCLIEKAKMLFATYGWWSIAIVIVVTALMFPVNFGLKKAFEKQTNEKIIRLQKILSALCVFVVAAVVLYFFELVFGEHNYDFGYIFINTMSVAFMSMALWAIIKVARDCGIKPLIVWISGKLYESKYVKSLYDKIEINDVVKSNIWNFLSELIEKNTDGTVEKIDEYFSSNKQSIYNYIKTTLAFAEESGDAKQVMEQFHELFTCKSKDNEII